ncbi:hypothetical protein B0T10DRAFT_454740 [Thelonectria olida]|uniref:Uncharacterized protein n=1 Tax=Thelonectria olida TaxID=1576542 RepID=A0A9P8WE57_9HYPO|nr:hypothetical protein B0T10DRAFT_454740 [Thelonectria olida]
MRTSLSKFKAEREVAEGLTVSARLAAHRTMHGMQLEGGPGPQQQEKIPALQDVDHEHIILVEAQSVNTKPIVGPPAPTMTNIVHWGSDVVAGAFNGFEKAHFRLRQKRDRGPPQSSVIESGFRLLPRCRRGHRDTRKRLESRETCHNSHGPLKRRLRNDKHFEVVSGSVQRGKPTDDLVATHPMTEQARIDWVGEIALLNFKRKEDEREEGVQVSKANHGRTRLNPV